jgi:NADH-quinone oxidoreductase subunit A
MPMEEHLSAFGSILIFTIVAMLFVVAGLITARFIRPNRPNPDKSSIYESGEETVGSAWGQFNIRFYVLALVFILFDVEIIFLFPWAMVFGNAELIHGTNGLWGKFAISEMFVFIGILALGLAYVWRKGYLDWASEGRPKQETYVSPIPIDAYKKYLNSL